MKLQGTDYTLLPLREMGENDNPLSPISDWFKNSKAGEYTNYFRYVVFNVCGKFLAAYRHTTDNYELWECWEV